MRLIDESPVAAFVSFVHGDATLSSFFVENISQQGMDNENVSIRVLDFGVKVQKTHCL